MKTKTLLALAAGILAVVVTTQAFAQCKGPFCPVPVPQLSHGQTATIPPALAVAPGGVPILPPGAQSQPAMDPRPSVTAGRPVVRTLVAVHDRLERRPIVRRLLRRICPRR